MNRSSLPAWRTRLQLAPALELARALQQLATQARAALRQGPMVGLNTLAWLAGIYFALACNAGFLQATMAGRHWTDAGTWVFGAAMLLLLAAVHTLLLGLVLHGRLAKPVLTGLLLAAAFATYFMQQYGVVLDPGMLRNVLNTDPAEARELLGWGLLPHVLWQAGLPIALLWWVRLRRNTAVHSIVLRATTVLSAAVLSVLAVLLVFQDFSSLMRNHKELRYLITPVNLVYSSARALVGETRSAGARRTPVGTDAKLGPLWVGRSKPVLFVVVVGETARAANWGLNGYARQTTPELAKLDVLNFPDVSACGTNTETSVPCMFSAVGRRAYDEQRIRGSESLLDVLARAGFGVLWRDNQSGCKGVCAGVASEQLDKQQPAALCPGGHCPDEDLLQGLELVAKDAKGNMVLVLHMLGNHGPAYFRRYPQDLRRFTPACDTDELRKCSTQQIVNAYDNALLYTDRVLAHAIGFLKAEEPKFDTGLIYLSDHGESLGENGLYLHGMPYAIAPKQQLKVPMVWWLSPGLRASFGLDLGCLQAQAARPWSHDNLFHTLLGLLQVSTSVYEPGLDISAACRR